VRFRTHRKIPHWRVELGDFKQHRAMSSPDCIATNCIPELWFKARTVTVTFLRKKILQLLKYAEIKSLMFVTLNLISLADHIYVFLIKCSIAFCNKNDNKDRMSNVSYLITKIYDKC